MVLVRKGTYLMKLLLTAFALFLAAAPVSAQGLPDNFQPGPVIEEFGPNATVDQDLAIPDGLDLKVAFDISAATEPDKVSREFETVEVGS